MPLRSLVLVPLLLASACGGGGGASETPAPIGSETRLSADTLEIGAAVVSVDLLVQLIDTPAVAPTLLQVAVELPPQLTLPPNDRLQAAQALATLDGDFVDGRFLVMCGDAQNAAGSTLGRGPLFRVRLQPASPRVPGTYTVRLHHLRASSRDGEALAVDANPAVVTVVVR